MIHFVGAGCGAADLITVRGKALLEQADVIVYAGSLVNPALLEYKKEGCRVYDSARMTLEEVLAVMQEAEAAGLDTVRLHTGDPCLYGAIREQMDQLDQRGIPYDYCPGVSAFSGAAAALKMEYTLPEISQSVIITRMAGRTAVPERESVRSFAAHLFLHDDSVPDPEAPVVRPVCPDRQEIGGIMVLPDHRRIGDQQIRLKHIRAGQQVTGHQR